MFKSQVDQAKLRSAFKFFFRQAGYAVGSRAAGALSLARAEAEAERRGWRVAWEPERQSYLDVYGVLECCERANRKCRYLHADADHLRYYDACPEHIDDTHLDVLCATLQNADEEYLASLGMISNPDSDYRRKVEAELAQEALYTLNEEEEQERAWLDVAAI